MRNWLACSLAVALTLAGSAQAAVKNGPQAVSATTANSCVIQSTSAVVFGAYNPTSGTMNTGNGQIVLRCTKKASYSVTSNSGQNGGALRSAAGDLLSYSLYSDAAYSKVFAAGAAPQGYDSGKAWQCFGLGTTNVQPTNATAIYATSGNGTYYTNFVGSADKSSNCPSGFKAAFSTTALTYKDGAQPPVGGTSQFIYLPPTSSGITGTSPSGITPITLPLYGKVPASQDVRPGSFTDLVTVTVTF